MKIENLFLRLIFLAPVAMLTLALGLVTGCTTERGPVTFRVMTYNIQHGAGMDKKIDFQRTADAINHEHPDIVALEEVDKGVKRTDGRDLTAELAAMTHLTGYFSNNFHFQGGEYGNAVLTRFPILHATNTHYKMLWTNEQRGVIQLVLNVHGRKLVFLTTHIDYRQANTERLMNVAQMKEIIKAYPGLPLILCGDFNDFPATPVHAAMSETFEDMWQLVSQEPGLTFPSDKPRERIDYMWLLKNKSVIPLRAWVPATQASDHRPLVADFQLK